MPSSSLEGTRVVAGPGLGWEAASAREAAQAAKSQVREAKLAAEEAEAALVAAREAADGESRAAKARSSSGTHTAVCARGTPSAAR